MKRSLFVLMLVSTLIIGWISLASAAGYEFGGLGTRALSMGGAYVGLADDWTAVYWNPAGLALLEGKGLGVAFDMPTITQMDGNSVSNAEEPFMPIYSSATLPAPLAGLAEPDTFEEEEVSLQAVLPSLGGYAELKDEWVFGSAVYVPVGYKVEWEDEISYDFTYPFIGPSTSEIGASLSTEIGMVVYNISLARFLNPFISVGAGANLIWGKFNNVIEKTYENSHNAVTQLNYSSELELQGSGTGVEGMFGLMVLPHPDLSFGGVWRSGVLVTLTGEAAGKFESDNLLLAAVVADEESNYTQRFNHPSTFGIGLAYKPGIFIFTTDWARTDWSSLKMDVDFEDEGTLLKDIDKNYKWRVTDRIRFGVECRPNEVLALRAGYHTDTAAPPDDMVDITKTVEADTSFVTLGIGLNGESWQVDAGFVSSYGLREIDDVEYEKRGTGILLAGHYQF